MKGQLNLWLMVIAAVCALSFWFGRDLIQPRQEVPEVDRSHPETGGAATGDDTSAVDAVHLAVLNGTRRGGLAKDFALLLGRLGCVVERIGNAPNDSFEQTLLVNRQLPEQQARELAQLLGNVPVVREFDPRATADAVLILGDDSDQVQSSLVRSAKSQQP